MKESESIALAVEILNRKGFSKINFIGKPFDLEAEKNGIKYAIEVKCSDISYTTSWHQVRSMYFDYFLLKNHALLMFVTNKGDYCIFQMTDALF